MFKFKIIYFVRIAKNSNAKKQKIEMKNALIKYYKSQ